MAHSDRLCTKSLRLWRDLIMGGLGKIAALQEEQGRILARLVAASGGVVR